MKLATKYLYVSYSNPYSLILESSSVLMDKLTQMNFSEDLSSKKSEMEVALKWWKSEMVASVYHGCPCRVGAIKIIIFTWSIWTFFITFDIIENGGKACAIFFDQSCCMASFT